jgi:hypothetical protein
VPIAADIFVFGSSLTGRHTSGPALEARRRWGAVDGEVSGRTGMAYAIPTHDECLRALPLSRVAVMVDDFLHYARERQHLTCHVPRDGWGHPEKVMVELFARAPENCVLPEGWRGCQHEAIRLDPIVDPSSRMFVCVQCDKEIV